MIRWVAAILAAAMVAVACTGDGSDDITPTPTPSSSDLPAPTSVAVVLPPPGAISPEAAQALRDAIEATVAAEAGAVTTRIVQPDGPGFVGDVAAVLAADGASLVCTVDTTAAAELVAAAASAPGTRFCVDAATAIDAPTNVWAPQSRNREVAFLVGVAIALIEPEGLVGMVLREGRPALNAKRAGIVDGYAAALLEADPDAAPLAPVIATIPQQAEDFTPIVQAVTSQEPEVVFLDVGLVLTDVVDIIAEQAPGTTIVAWANNEQAAVLPADAVIVARDELSTFRLAFTAVQEGTFDRLPPSVGVAEGAFSIRPVDPTSESVDLTGLDRWVERLLNGELDIG